MDPTHYDYKIMRQAVKNLNPGKYKLFGNNCQTYADKLKRLQKSPLWATQP